MIKHRRQSSLLLTWTVTTSSLLVAGILILETLPGTAATEMECCYDNTGKYDPAKYFETQKGGLCEDGTTANPCCGLRKYSCESDCCKCDGGCKRNASYVSPMTTSTTTNTPSAILVSAKLSAGADNAAFSITTALVLVGAVLVIAAIIIGIALILKLRGRGHKWARRFSPFQSQLNKKDGNESIEPNSVPQAPENSGFIDVPNSSEWHVSCRLECDEPPCRFLKAQEGHSVEIQPGELCIDRADRIGNGETGLVVGGKLRQKFDPLSVAIKFLNPGTRKEHYIQAMNVEACIMQELGEHPNIVRLLGIHRKPAAASISNGDSGPSCVAPYIIMERCANGSLKQYLDQIRLKGKFSCRGRKITIEWQNGSDVTTSIYTPHDLVLWMYQIANAMEYVHSKKILHCDIAARNILFYDRNLVKLTDFGLARRLENDSDRTYLSGEKIPWQWCPPELLCTAVPECEYICSDDAFKSFSTYSDIWAFGVTMWEAFSLGLEPYGDTITPSELLNALRSGQRLPEPKFILPGLYDVMKQCWELDPKKRISFGELKNVLHQMSLPSSEQALTGYLKP